jgi:glycosyltransferase involved in cell wall biosynthesis
MEIEKTKFSFIIPCWEQTNLLKCLLQSIWCQTYTNWEVILVHDGPNPSHEKALGDLIGNSRFKYTNTEVRYGYWGHYGREVGTRLATGDWIIHTNDDNYFMPILLEEINSAITRDPEINFVYWEMILGKYVNEHSHNKKDYGHFIPKVQHSYMDWGQFATKSEVIKKYSINKHEAAADGTLVENMKHELNPVFIDKCLFVHN